VGARENTIEVLEDQLINTQQQLEEANQHLDMHHQEFRTWRPTRMLTSREQWSRSPHLAWTLLAQGDPLPPSQVLPRLFTKLHG
jgi:uncharacterized coiled-coil protein SlyX